MSQDIMHVGDQNFKKEVLDSDQLVAVDFYAQWCMPCKILTPILEEVASGYSGKVKFAKLDIDDARDTSMQNKIMGVPSILFFKDGKEVGRIIGLKKKEEIQTVIDNLVK